MATPATEDLRELERLLAEAGDLGRTRSFESLREELGLGHNDLTEAIDTLREVGKAVEVAPGEWSGPNGDESGEPEPLRVSVPEVAESERLDAAAAALRRRDGGQAYEAAVASGLIGGPETTVRLTRAIADELDAAALGQIVKAGLKGVDATVPFVLEVQP